MNKICVIEAGDFLLGIDAGIIVSIKDMDRFVKNKQADPPSLFHLASLLSKQSLPVPEGDKIVIEVKNDTDIFIALLADRVIGEIKAPSHFEPLPLLYPDLSSKCFPHVFLYNEQVVLLLDMVEFIAMAENTDNPHGIFSFNDFSSVTETGYETKTDCNESQADLSVSSLEDKPSVNLQGAHTHETKTVPPKTAMDEIIFNKIVIWTIDAFVDCDKNEPIVITMDMIPPELIQQGSNDEKVQTVVDETIASCMKLNRKILHILTPQVTDVES